jgi:hypothetical protein
MIESMNQEQFVVELKQLRCNADLHRRYYAEQTRKYSRIDYWLKSGIGFFALVGVVLVGVPETRIYGALLASGCAFFMSNVLPNFKWDSIVAGFVSEEQEWTKIFYGYEDLIRVAEISERGEILIQEFQKVREMQRTAALNDRHLPVNKKLFVEKDLEVRGYYNLPKDPYKTEEE